MINPAQFKENASALDGYWSVMDFGATGDGVTDDTDAIQAGINFVYARGGGTLFFPFTKKGYRLAKPAREEINGQPCRSQLYIPAEVNDLLHWKNICLMGEMPVVQLHTYQIRAESKWGPATEFEMRSPNVFLFSDWDAPEETDRNARPWSLISVLGGTGSPFGLGNLTIRNIEFRVLLNPDKMYPTSSGGNFASKSRLILEHLYFGLDKNVGSSSQNKELLASPCFTAGVITSADQNDHQLLNSVGVQGFRFGFVLGERVSGRYLHVHNCEEGLVFHDSSHLSMIDYVAASHNRVMISALREPTFGLKPSQNIFVRIMGLDYEKGLGTRPTASVNEYIVSDPDNRITGELMVHSGYPSGAKDFTMLGGQKIKVTQFGEWVK